MESLLTKMNFPDNFLEEARRGFGESDAWEKVADMISQGDPQVIKEMERVRDILPYPQRSFAQAVIDWYGSEESAWAAKLLAS